VRHVGAAELRQRLPMPALVRALREGFARGAIVPPRQVLALPGGGSSLLMPAWREAEGGGGAYAVKVVNVCPANRDRGLPAVQAMVTLFDLATGAPRLTLDGGELTVRRTVAASALAAGFLAHPEATRHLIVGAGQIAALLHEGMRVVRPGLAQLRLWNHRPEGAVALAARLREQGLDAQAVTDLAAAAAEAQIISCATLSEQALVRGEWLAPGTHLDLIGSFTPAMREADGACFARARVFVDTEEALAKAGCVLQAQAEGGFDPARLQGTLAQLCRGQRPGRQQAHEITLFKSVGTALEDLAAAELVMQGLDNPGP
jgi:ornithine cyclodeaminase/alanine dehydrogenase-like protein (mu-crystallin family)